MVGVFMLIIKKKFVNKKFFLKNNILWSYVIIGLLLGLGLYFTIGTRFFLSAAIFMFAFSSIIGSYYYGEANIEFISKGKTALFVYRVLAYRNGYFRSAC